MKVKVADVAREAGVSRATVSRVLNGSAAVNPRSVAQVQRAIARLGYVRSVVRPGPKPRLPHPSRLRTGSIALVVLGQTRHLLEEPTMAWVIEEIQAACRKRGISLLLDQMTAVDQIPLCVQARQVDGVLAMKASGPLSGYPDFIAVLSELIPVVQVFTPGHAAVGVDHVTVNDVAIGALAFEALETAGCRSMAVVDGGRDFHEALMVRGRAFKDRAALLGIPAHYFARSRDGFDVAQCLPRPLVVFDDFSEVAVVIQRDLPGPVGIFLTLEMSAPELHEALEKVGFFKEKGNRLIVAGTTSRYVGGLIPPPLLIDISFREVVNIAVERLIDRVLSLPARKLTFLAAPHLVG